MNKNQVGWVILLLVVILAAAVLQPMIYKAFNRTTQWEYCVVSPDDNRLRITINELGDDGWELAFTRRALRTSTDKYIYEMIFKRRK